MSRPLERKFGRRRILLGFGVARTLWLTGLAFVGPGVTGLVVVIAIEFAMITCIGIFTPVFASYRLERAPDDAVARVLTAWTISSRTAIAVLTALWGVLASLTSVRIALGVAGLSLLLTSLLLPWRRQNWESTESASANDVTTAAT